MNLDLLLSFVQAPHKMADHAVSDLEDMVAEYPYFSAAQMLLLKQYKLQNSSKFNKQLRHAAGVLPDRKQLYRLIEIWPEEVEQAIEAENSATVMPAQDASPAVELDALAASVSELAAPLSEVPLKQLEEVQGLGAETSAAAVEAEKEAAEVVSEVVHAPVEDVRAEDTIAEEAIAEELIAEEAIVEVSIDEEVIADKATTVEVITADALVKEAQQPSAATSQEVDDQLAISPKQEVIAAANTPAIEEWPVPPVVAPEVLEAAEEQAIEAAALNAEELVSEPEVPVVVELPVEVPLVKAEVPLQLATEAESAATPVPEPVVVKVVTPPAVSALKTATSTTAIPPIAPQEVAAFIAQPHARLSWFKFFAGKPLREQSDEVLDQLYQEHMQQDLLRAPEQDQQISAIRAQINRDEEVPSSKALEEEIRRLAYESISDDELPASETLAGIYAAQHDYKKAIRIYQKLILKFPDKMSYFARLIEDLRAKS